jgi:hypothetical protein
MSKRRCQDAFANLERVLSDRKGVGLLIARCLPASAVLNLWRVNPFVQSLVEPWRAQRVLSARVRATVEEVFPKDFQDVMYQSHAVLMGSFLLSALEGMLYFFATMGARSRSGCKLGFASSWIILMVTKKATTAGFTVIFCKKN